ncbi:MAG TPA: hypothetical protein DEB61_06080 [Alcanivorax sp.]|nr:hypothetical protein [Alcanivorax sp.]MBF47623.1 hypothetical protein [Alcanivorax sp.]HAD46589.1 hypothetical protein [Alcanivorax sp.]HAI34125.1 hypothetical protein [Alcanivorax sp.]HAI90664.1 hypothetical protein [Alcanivorax sp.]|tara:strand:+ start:549 stop:2216 length:1668 start_codon:yes stop_codon:yes gene_type:complete
MKHRCLLALAPLLLMLAATGHAERRYFTQYDSPAKAPEQALYYVDLPLPENPDGPGYLYRAYYRENDALYAEGARAGAGPGADWFGDWRYLYPDGDIKQRGHSDDQGRLDGDVISYFENGRIEKVKPYTAGKLDGTEKRYDEDGDLLLELPYRDGARHGMRINYYGEGGGPEGGQIYEERRYKNGDYDHFYNRYDRDGQRIGHAGYTAPGVFMAWSKDREGRYSRREASFQRDAQGRYRNDAPVWLRVIADHDGGGPPERVVLSYPREKSEWTTGFRNGKVVRLEHDVDGIPQGHRIVSQYGGGREEGRMVDGLRTGTWRGYDDQDRLISVSHFKKGRLDGEVRERSGPEGERWTYKHYRQDKQHGPWRTENADGEVLESGRYRDGVPVGEWHTLRDTGEQETATYVDGELHGEWRLRSASGALIAERHYDHGDATGTWKRFQDGELSYRATFKDGKRQGEVFEISLNGNHTFAHFQAGRLDGPYRETTPQGYPLLQGHYQDGQRHGRFVEYNAQGRVERITPYRNGQRQGEGWLRGRDGELVKARWEDGRRVTP